MKGEYGQSEHGNFKVVDTIGTPHPYCITPKHVAYAANNHNGMLNEAAIEGAEQYGAHCGVRGCQLPYNKHEQALLVNCKKDFNEGDKINPELQAYLLAIKDECERNGYAGFAFKKDFVAF